MDADHRPGAFAVEIEVAHMIFTPRSFQPRPVTAVDRPGQAIFCTIANRQRIVIVVRPDHRQHRPKDFLLSDSRVGWNVAKNRRWDEVTAFGSLYRRTAEQKF